ncbi:MAG TPA: hypothetical protein VNX70_03500 [Bryobacteraceae bacterium]|nr:hypothetical protein [Bryobacteraceae bacterium]
MRDSNEFPMNPNGETRMDRMERLLEAYIQHNERAHENFEREHKDLLTAQVVLTGHMDVVNVKLAEVGVKLAEVGVKLAEVTDKLNGLIGVVDDIIRRPPPGRPTG